VQGLGEVLRDDAVREAKLIKGNCGFGGQAISQALLKKLQTIDQVSSTILLEGFDEFTHSAYNECSVISERPFADVDDMIDLELPPTGAPYHLGFSHKDNFQ